MSMNANMMDMATTATVPTTVNTIGSNSLYKVNAYKKLEAKVATQNPQLAAKEACNTALLAS